MSSNPARRGNSALSALTGLMALADAGLALLGLLIWNAYRRDNLTGSEAATFTLLGVSAAVGALILLTAAIGLARHSQGATRLATALAGLRTAAVVVALAVIAIQIGGSALAGLLETTGALVALFDALIALWVTAVAARRTRHR
ncbi:hypothetical protein [Paractinoplanes brasiliensis]|uniref:Uncharacterized protein n=1 Tax=Paractinoplanes brasiliensis TaxID=52695 RepID=A0A4R6JK10_9ACTN|nr:hypothetical protein [Actinoplanes brasiliensis]TDO36563.1 hypothetical protein C8E87_0140 [Actinoplanes brasiliensis]GID32470.1 hypothetical protein Abr02nite_74530 [Actinoplanes brasiliensis]